MKWIKKNVLWTVCTILCAMILLLCLPTLSAKPVRFLVYSDNDTKEISVFDGTDGIKYVFLPSYAKMEQVEVVLDKGKSIAIGGKILGNGTNCESFELETDYSYRDENGNDSTIRFYRSANIPTMYIDTATGSMDQIHKHKDVEEHMSVNIYSSDGMALNYNLNGVIKGRGNTTWSSEKKPYTIKLTDETNLFGMGMATNWILLSNGMDETNLRNKTMFSIANRIGMEWSPECQFVDLYLNGEYNGLYLLAEKVEVGPSRLNIDPGKGDFLCKVELEDRWEILENPIKTEANRTVDLLSMQENDKEKIQSINELEKILLTDLDLSTAFDIDLDSWVKRYLIDEISANVDSDQASSYFYYRNGVFYAGPIWDYDLTFHQPPQGHFFRANKSQRANLPRTYYEALYKNESFYNRMVEVYEEQFVPILEKTIETDVPAYAKEIEKSFLMDGRRWSKSEDVYQAADEITTYLQDRMAFLNSAWIDGVIYHSVQVEETVGADYRTFSVKDGQKFETDMVDLANTTWYIKATGEKFDPSKPISEDIILVKQLTSDQTQLQAENTTGRDLREYITYASIFGIAVFLIFLVAVDIYRRRRERVK